jgi:hypothetical protein
MNSLMIGSLESYQRRPISGYSNSNWPAPEGESRSEDGNGNQNAGFFDSIGQFRWMGTAGASAFHPLRKFASEFAMTGVDPKRDIRAERKSQEFRTMRGDLGSSAAQGA